MFTALDITAFVVLCAGVTLTISALAQCSKKKNAANTAPLTNPKTDVDRPEGSQAKPPASSQPTTPPDVPGNASKNLEPKSGAKNLDKTQTQQDQTGEGNERTKDKSKDEEDTFEQHKPECKEAKRAKEILSKPSIPKNRDDYKTFNKKNMPESDFDKTMSEVK